MNYSKAISSQVVDDHRRVDECIIRTALDPAFTRCNVARWNEMFLGDNLTIIFFYYAREKRISNRIGGLLLGRQLEG